MDLVAGEHRRPEFLRVNPAGKLPTLVDGDAVVTESVAIVMYLAEKYPEKGFLPANLRDRAQAYRWLLFAATELEQHMDGRRFVVGDRVTVADFVTAYTLDWANENRLLGDFPRLRAYMERMYERPLAPMRIKAAFAAIRG